MNQKDLRVGLEVAVSAALHGGRRKRAKVLRKGVETSALSRRKDGATVEFLDPCAPFSVGDQKVVRTRDIDMTWEEAVPLEEARKNREESGAIERERGAERIARLADRIQALTGIDAEVEMASGRELGRDPANRIIRQKHGERVKLDVAAVEALLSKLDGGA